MRIRVGKTSDVHFPATWNIALVPIGFLWLLLFAGPVAFGQSTVLSEGFEGAFPGNWTVSDQEPDDGFAYWADVPLTFGSPLPHSGQWMGYCAGVGFLGDETEPYYRSYMLATMARTINLSNFTSATLTFWYSIPSIESCCDICEVYVDNTRVWFRNTAVFNMTQATVDLTPYVGGSHTLVFLFSSDDSIEGEGWYLDDILVVGNGGGGGQPNLTPHQPVGWSDRIVVSRTQGTSTDSANLTPADTLYVDWSVLNNGTAATGVEFDTDLYVDGVLRNTWVTDPPLPSNTRSFLQDYSLGSLNAGTHTIRIVADGLNAIAESNEADNEYTKTITLSGTPDIRIQPLTLTFDLTNSSLASVHSENSLATPIAQETANLSPDQKLISPEEVRKPFREGQEKTRVMVNLQAPRDVVRATDWNSRASLQALHAAVKSRQDEVLGTLGPNEFEMRHRFENQAGFSAELTEQALERLLRHPRVTSIQPVHQWKRHLAQGIPLMNGMLYRSSYNGAGVSVAIVDTGVDYNHPRLGGGGFPNTKVIGGYDFADSDSNPLPVDAHGTACAGIAAGNLATVGSYIGGVAPYAKIYALKTESNFGGSSSSDDVLAAWDWCVTHKNDNTNNPILVISTSLGGNRYYGFCDMTHAAEATAANNAVAAGITLLVSSGNEGFCDSVASPACLSGVISVGAVYDAGFGAIQLCTGVESCAPKVFDPGCDFGLDYHVDDATAADKVTSYSNMASFLGVLAPSHNAYTTDISGAGGYSSGDYDASFGGTSAACPYAAGAVACLQSAAKTLTGSYLSPAEVKSRLLATGNNVTDTKVAITKPRINLGRAIESLGLEIRTFTIFNDGTDELSITSMTLESAASWIDWSPKAPFTIAPGRSNVIAVMVNPSLAPPGASTRRLLVASSDPDESPYPAGVFITVNKPDTRPSLTASRTANTIVLSWPTNHSAGFVLESATNLPAPSWTTVTNTPAVIGGFRFVTNNVSGQRKFFRLRQ